MNAPAPRSRLLADIGGTNLRLAWQAAPGAAIEDVQVLHTDDFASVEAAIRHYLTTTARPVPQEAAFGVAGAVTGDNVQLTNHAWTFAVPALASTLGLRRLLVINDFTALALAVQELPACDLRKVGGTCTIPGAPIALLGPGTGLGVSGLLFPSPCAIPVPIAGEGGHVTLAAQSREEFQVIEHLARGHGHVSAERVLSGPGLLNLYHALRAGRGQSGADVPTPARLLELALVEREPLCLATLEMFCGFLGSVAGNLALTLGARGGVYLGGGIVPRLGPWFDTSPFRERFEAKGRFRDYLAAVPCWVIVATQSPALLGAARALDQLPPAL